MIKKSKEWVTSINIVFDQEGKVCSIGHYQQKRVVHQRRDGRKVIKIDGTVRNLNVLWNKALIHVNGCVRVDGYRDPTRASRFAK